MTRAERRAGEILLEMPKNKGTRAGGNTMLPPDNTPRLKDLGIEKMEAHRWQTIARKLERIERELHAVRESLGSEPAEAEPVEPEGPVVDAARRLLIFKGRHVDLTAAQCRLAELLLSRPGESFTLDEIDAFCRPPSESWASPGAVRQSVSRFRRRLRDAGLDDLARGIFGGYRSYSWHVLSDVIECQRQCHGSCGTLSGECKPKPKGK